LLLARAGWSTVVLEKQTFPRAKVCGEYLSATNWPLLEQLGLAELLESRAGPSVRRVGLMAGSYALVAELPTQKANGASWGRALSRAKLDTWLLGKAAEAGAQVHQPAVVERLKRSGRSHICQVQLAAGDAAAEFSAPVVIAAHGSWGTANLPTSVTAGPARGSDLFGFKAHFSGAKLPPDLMPLLCFPGGYGGMVTSDEGRLSLSCCVRRDTLAALAREPGQSAGAAVVEHIMATTPAVAAALHGAQLVDRWLAAGPIRPGMRWRYRHGAFRAGNAAGEAHPVVAEGITMAMQSGALAAECLLRACLRPGVGDIDQAGRRYAALWKRQFAARLRVAALVAHWAMRPMFVRSCLPLVQAVPGILTWGAYHSGKSKPFPFIIPQVVHSWALRS
jgi:flavin-dependent dehydrogenase